MPITTFRSPNTTTPTHELGQPAGLERRRHRPGTGFPQHPHRDMEIITYVREGAITHQDNLGNKGRTEAGDVQVMSAGTGMPTASTTWKRRRPKIFQIWIHSRRIRPPPSWGAKPFPKASAKVS
jgi:redox-sensitive bicupin YhaK (pirin superfamily)